MYFYEDIEVDKETFEKFLQTYPNKLRRERWSVKGEYERGTLFVYFDDENHSSKYGYIANYFADNTKTTYYILNYFFDKRVETNGK